MKPPLSIIVSVCIMAAICASLGWIGITDQQLTTAGKLGITTSLGLSAVLKGWLWMAAAFGFIGILVARSAFRNILWLGLLVLYIFGVIGYFLAK